VKIGKSNKINENNSTMKKIYFLSTCSTCNRIIQELKLQKNNFIYQDIKTEKITAKQLEELKNKSGSYESLFSRTAMKYRSMGLNNQTLAEKDYRKYILEEYTFLKRPVILVGENIFVGNSKKTIAEAKKAIEKIKK
jgi:arsenate reductase (glutaredoxin)